MSHFESESEKRRMTNILFAKNINNCTDYITVHLLTFCSSPYKYISPLPPSHRHTHTHTSLSFQFHKFYMISKPAVLHFFKNFLANWEVTILSNLKLNFYKTVGLSADFNNQNMAYI